MAFFILLLKKVSVESRNLVELKLVRNYVCGKNSVGYLLFHKFL